jgi:hypothetical protein
LIEVPLLLAQGVRVARKLRSVIAGRIKAGRGSASSACCRHADDI